MPLETINGRECHGTAVFSPDGIYRYRLTRTWDAAKPVVAWVMLNPSTATAEVVDPTIRRCCIFAMDWGYGGIDVVNLFAMRATNPRVLTAEDPTGRSAIGRDNDRYIVETDHAAALVIAAWGAHGAIADRGRDVFRRLLPGGKVHVLSMTKSGHPGHPLYLKSSLRPVQITTMRLIDFTEALAAQASRSEAT